MLLEVTLTALNAPEGDVDVDVLDQSNGTKKEMDFDSGTLFYSSYWIVFNPKLAPEVPQRLLMASILSVE